jgi:hypothetical protein
VLQRFQRIHDANLSGRRNSVSWLGSGLDATAMLRAARFPATIILRTSRAICCDAILWRDGLVHFSFANVACAVENFRPARLEPSCGGPDLQYPRHLLLEG